jgi:hypothetical protein
VGCPRRESGESEPGTCAVRVHAVRLGGRNRSDTSCAFSTGRSQGLLVNERALARRKSVAPFDAERGWVEGKTVRVHGIPQKSLPCTACRFRLAGSRYDERRSRAFARLALTGRATQGPLVCQVNSPSPSARSVMRDSTSGEQDFDSGVPADDNGTSEVDTIR